MFSISIIIHTEKTYPLLQVFVPLVTQGRKKEINYTSKQIVEEKKRSKQKFNAILNPKL